MKERSTVFRFGDFELDEARRELRQGGEPLAIQLKPFQLLAYLVRHRDRAVPKEELFENVWPDAVVSDAALASALRDVRRLLGDDGRRQQWIRTERERGFRFLALAEAGETAAGQPSPVSPRSPFAGPPLVGRDEILAPLETALDEACRGRGRVVLLGGEAGVGKTRLAQEIAERAEARGLGALWSRCWDGEGALPFWPWIQILRAVLREVPTTALARTLGPQAEWIVRLIPELRDLEPELPAPAQPHASEARFRLYDAVVRVLHAHAAGRPVVVVVDDLQWADADSLELLRFLAANLGDARLLLVGTYRDVELTDGHPLAALLPVLAREDTVERLAVRSLDPAETAVLVEQLVGHEPDPDFTGALYAHTQGNPFFVQETLRHLEESGPEGSRAGAWKLSLDRLGLPESVRHVIERRISLLAEPSQALLRVAAVVGPDFDLALLERIDPGQDAPASDRLEPALSAHLVTEAEGAYSYHFAHPLVRETLYQGLGGPERRALHRAVGEALEALRGADPEPPLAALAHHFDQAGETGSFEKAFTYAVRAARQSLERFAYGDAASQFARALRLQERTSASDTKLRCDLLLGLGDAQCWGDRPEPAQETYRRAVELARARASPEQLARAAFGLESARWVVYTDPPETHLPLLEEALATLGDRDRVQRVHLLARLSYAFSATDDPRRDEVTAEAVELARRTGDADALAYALGARLYALSGPEMLEERRRLTEESASIAPSQLVAHGASNFAYLDALRVGDLAGVEAALEAGSRVSEGTRSPFRIAIAHQHRGDLAMLQGRLGEAERAAMSVARVAQELSSENLTALGLQLVGCVRLLQGRLVELLPFMEGDPGRNLRERRIFHAARLLVRLEAGRSEEVREAFDRLAGVDFDPPEPSHNEVVRLAFLAETCFRLRHREGAQRLTPKLRPYLPQNLVGLAGFAGSSCHRVGQLAAVCGRYDEALQLLEEALDGYRSLGALPWAAWAQAARAQVFLLRDGPGDHAHAAELLDRALAAARDLGLPGLEALVDRLRC
jgi:DNA-binding winged helix-turn-helix (wHTH) protein/tetratricopeptide (TPR) repeat protein